MCGYADVQIKPDVQICGYADVQMKVMIDDLIS